MSASRTPSRGTFIVIEGLDRSGKTTQVAKLTSALQASGKKVEQLRFPNRTTTIGRMIDQYLQSKSELEDHVIHLLFSANRWELASKIESILLSGTSIICDRYCYSGMIYSAAKRNPSLSLAWARNPDVGLPRPDVVLFLNLDEREAEKRGGYGEEKYEKREMQLEVRKLFQKLGKLGEEEEEDMVVIDAGFSVEEVHEKVLDAALSAIQLTDERANGFEGGSAQEVRRVSNWPSGVGES